MKKSIILTLHVLSCTHLFVVLFPQLRVTKSDPSSLPSVREGQRMEEDLSRHTPLPQCWCMCRLKNNRALVACKYGDVEKIKKGKTFKCCPLSFLFLIPQLSCVWSLTVQLTSALALLLALMAPPVMPFLCPALLQLLLIWSGSRERLRGHGSSLRLRSCPRSCSGESGSVSKSKLSFLFARAGLDQCDEAP